MSLAAIWERSDLGGGSCTCKGPEVGTCLTWLEEQQRGQVARVGTVERGVQRGNSEIVQVCAHGEDTSIYSGRFQSIEVT